MKFEFNYKAYWETPQGKIITSYPSVTIENKGNRYYYRPKDNVLVESLIAVEQPIGIKDKAGIEVHTRDIIRIKAGRRVAGELVFEPIISVVNHYPQSACFGFTSKHGWLSFLMNENYLEGSIEIIGNIHENPKLLFAK